MLGEDLTQDVHGVLARINDHAVLALGSREDVRREYRRDLEHFDDLPNGEAKFSDVTRRFTRTFANRPRETPGKAAIAGLGLACLSRHALEEPLALGRLRVLETPLPALQRTLWLVRHPGKQWLPGLQALLGEVG